MQGIESRFRLPIRRRVNLGFTLALGLVLALAVIAYHSGVSWSIVVGGGVFVAVALGSIALIGREIGHHRRLDRGLRAVEARYRTLFDRNLVAIARSRRDGTMLDCNTALVRLLGYASREEVLGTSASQFYADPTEDNGIGIEPGIGLAIVQKGSARLSGRVGVESDPGAGSRFWVELREAEDALA